MAGVASSRADHCWTGSSSISPGVEFRREHRFLVQVLLQEVLAQVRGVVVLVHPLGLCVELEGTPLLTISPCAVVVLVEIEIGLSECHIRECTDTVHQSVPGCFLIGAVILTIVQARYLVNASSNRTHVMLQRLGR